MQHRITLPDHLQSTLDDIVSRNRTRFAGWRMEGEEDPPPADDPPADPTPSDDPEKLGDAGKQAIDRMKAERNAERKRAATAEAELDKLRNASKSEQEKAVDAARKEGETQAIQKANGRLVRSEARALAATAKFRDPSDAIAQLGDQLADITVDEDGEVDQKALKALVDDLAKSKPYLLDAGDETPSASDAGIGTTGAGKPQPGSRAADHAQIEADLAGARGRR